MNRQLHILAAWFFGSVIALWAAVMVVITLTAERPAEGRVAVVFPPSMSEEHAIAAIASAGARPIGRGWTRWVWAADLDTASAEGLERHGAWLVVREFPFVVALGCAGAYATNSIRIPSPAAPRER